MPKTSPEALEQEGLDEEELSAKMKELGAYIGQQAKIARTRLGLTQAQVGARGHTTSNQIFLIEAGRSNMTIRTLLSLALILEVEPGDLLPNSRLTSERPDTNHLLSSIENRCGRAKAELDEIEGLMETLRGMTGRLPPQAG